MSLETRDFIIYFLRQNPQGVTQEALIKHLSGTNDVNELAVVLNDLIEENRVATYQSSAQGEPVFKAVADEEREKCQGLTPEQIVVYKVVESVQREGIWLKDMKKQSNLQLAALQKAIKTLEQKQLIKSFKSITSKNKKFYILYDLEPSLEHRGGIGYRSDLNFDREFINDIINQCHQFILHKGMTTQEEIYNYIKNSTNELQLEDIKVLVETLIYDGKVEPLKGLDAIHSDVSGKNNASILYKGSGIKLPVNGITSTPCGRCPVYESCGGGNITPQTCVYMKEWLNFI